MGKLFDILRAATAGQSDTLAAWRRAVSQAIDGDQVGTGTGFVQVARISDQGPLVASTATAVVFPVIQLAENAAFGAPPIMGTAEIGYDSASGGFTLTPGLYELEAHLILSTFTTDATDHAIFHWAISANLAVPLLPNVVSDVYPGTTTGDITSAPVNKMLFRVAAGANVVVAVSVTALAGTPVVTGAAAVPPVTGNSYALVRKLS